MTGQKELPELGQSCSCQELRFLWVALAFSNTQNSNLHVQGSSFVRRTRRKYKAAGRRQVYPALYADSGVSRSLLHPQEPPFSSFPLSPPHVLLLQFPFYETENLALLFGLPMTNHNHSLPLFQGLFPPCCQRDTTWSNETSYLGDRKAIVLLLCNTRNELQ